MFNIYLDDALNSQTYLKQKIQQNQLFAFADEIVITFQTEQDLIKIIESLE